MGRLLTLLRRKGGFSPLDLDGLALWLDASDLSTITHSSGAVSQWDDKSGYARHATQGDAAYQPTTGTMTLNGRNVLAFSTDILNLANAAGVFRNAGVGTAFAVARSTETTTPRRFLLGFSTNSPTQARFTPFANQAVNRFGFGGRRLNTDSFQTVSSTQDHAAAWRLAMFEVAWVNGQARIRENGAETLAPTAFQSAGSSDDSDSAAVQIGGLSTGDPGVTSWPGEIAELIVVRTAARLTAGEIASVERYLAAKWGVTLA